MRMMIENVCLSFSLMEQPGLFIIQILVGGAGEGGESQPPPTAPLIPASILGRGAFWVTTLKQGSLCFFLPRQTFGHGA